jgi:hypothetical protein
LYTITFDEEEDRFIILQEKLDKAKSLIEKREIISDDALNDLEIPKDNFIFFPTNVGIVKKAFEDGQSVIINNFQKNWKFTPFTSAIDNPKSCAHI